MPSEDLDFTLIANCPFCGEKVLLRAEECLNCGCLIDWEEVFPSAALNFVLTQATSAANNIRTHDNAALMQVFIALYWLSTGVPFWFLIISSAMWIYALARIAIWFKRYGRLRVEDLEYNFIQRGMKTSAKLWLTAAVFSIIVIVYMLTLPSQDQWRP